MAKVMIMDILIQIMPVILLIADPAAKIGMDAACKTIKEAVADFQKGNMRLGLALTLVKEEMK